MSRSPSSFFARSNRNSRDQSSFFSSHRRTTSYGDTLDRPRQVEELTVQRSLSGSGLSPVTSNPPAGTATLRGMERLEKRRTMEEKNFLQAKARSQNLNPPVDLRSLDYVAPTDENLMCPICRCPFVDPIVLTECDHCFCRDCIRQTWTTSGTYNPLGPRGDCPTCRTPAKLGSRSSTSKILVNILDDMMVKCPKMEEGCKAEVKRGEIQDHMNIYCGYATVECPTLACELFVRRKDSTKGCLHFPVSCLACHEEMQRVRLEKHWKSSCPDREITCNACKTKLYYRDLAEHNSQLCPASNIACPGKSLGCTSRSVLSHAEVHARSCTLAKMVPMFTTMKDRMDEQEAAQKIMSRKLEVLEGGFQAMHGVLFPKADTPKPASSGSNPALLLARSSNNASDDVLSPGDGVESGDHATPTQLLSPAPTRPGPRPLDLPDPYSADFDFTSPFPQPAPTGGPYASPLHHLLSMHESLRDEMSRMTSSLQELDGRHSMQILNENMRTREEITYMGAQVAGLSRQVHWLTSAQLQRHGGTSGSGAGGGVTGEGAGPSVEAAISSAVRGAARIVNAGREGMAMRRGPSEEGRTKL